MPSSEYQVKITIKSEDKTSKPAKSAADSMDGLKKTVQAVATAWAALKMAQAVVDWAKEGAAIQRQESALNNLAQSYGTTGGAIISAMQTTSDFTIDKMTAMGAANKAMILGVAQSPAEFERLTRVAVGLGRAMGQDATKSIDDFVVAAGRQSKMIADNLGLMVGAEEANTRYAKKLGISAGALTDTQKKQAFLNLMLEQGEEKLARLGPQVVDTAGKFEQLDVALKDASDGFKSILADYAAAIIGTNDLSGAIRQLPETWEKASLMGRAFSAGLQQAYVSGDPTTFLAGWNYAWQDWGQQQGWIVKEVSAEIERYGHTIKDVGTEIDHYGPLVKKATDALDDQAQAVPKVTSATQKYLDELALSEPPLDDMEGGSRDVAQAIREAEGAAIAAAKAFKLDLQASMLDTSISFSKFNRDVQEDKRKHAQTIEDIEAEHQKNLDDINKKGGSSRKKVNLEAENEKLALLQSRLAIALQQQSEYTDKTNESTKMAKTLQIQTLQKQIAEQQGLLQNAADGYIVVLGKNVAEDIALENTRYNEKKRLAAEANALVEADQRRSLGQLVLQSFDAWVQINGGVTEETMKMRAGLAEEYGLVDKGSAEFVGKMIDTFDKWKTGSNKSVAEVTKELDTAAAAAFNLGDAVNKLPAIKEIEIKVTQTGVQVTQGGKGPVLSEFQHGANFVVPPGYPDDSFPFMASTGERVIVIPREQVTTNNYTMNVNTAASSANVMRDFQVMQSMARI